MGGWGRVQKETYRWVKENGQTVGKQWDAQTDLMEVCVPIMDINECRNNYIVKRAKNWNADKLSDFKQKVERQVDWVYDGTNICAGSSSKDSCQVRFIVCFHLSGTQMTQ